MILQKRTDKKVHRVHFWKLHQQLLLLILSSTGNVTATAAASATTAIITITTTTTTTAAATTELISVTNKPINVYYFRKNKLQKAPKIIQVTLREHSANG